MIIIRLKANCSTSLVFKSFVVERLALNNSWNQNEIFEREIIKILKILITFSKEHTFIEM